MSVSVSIILKTAERRGEESTSELVCLQHLKEEQIHVPRVLDIVTVRLREISHITSAVIKRCRRIRRREQRRAALAADEKCPLVAARMPVDLAHPAGLDCHDGCRKVTGDGESYRIDNLD